MGQYKYWQMDNDNIVKMHKITARQEAIKNDKLLGFFEFEVKRYKDKNSKREQLEISAKVQGEDYGKIKADLTKLESELVRFKSYGVVLDRLKYVELCKLITDKYYYFEITEKDSIDYQVTDADAYEVLQMLCHYIHDNKIEAKEVKDRTNGTLELYHIPLEKFSSELIDSRFRNYNFTEIKEKLREKEYTHSNKGKFDYVVSENGQKVKMISIHKVIAEPILKELGMAEGEN